MRPYVQYHSSDAKVRPGKLWPAGRTIYGLCAAWNHASAPYRPMTDDEHRKARIYARAIMNRIKRMGFVYGKEYTEFSNGMLWPLNKD